MPELSVDVEEEKSEVSLRLFAVPLSRDLRMLVNVSCWRPFVRKPVADTLRLGQLELWGAPAGRCLKRLLAALGGVSGGTRPLPEPCSRQKTIVFK